MKKIPIIIDTDPGIDDAVAIAIALFDSRLDVKLITTVCGNVGIDKVTKNALKLLTFFDRKIPVAQGAIEPLINKLEDASSVHGDSGMDGYDFKEINENLLLKEHAIIAMRKIILESEEPITLVPIGPLTNIAMLLKVFPEVKEKIKEIIMMGGTATRGNFGVMSEFNIATDPEAARIVFESDVPITMIGLDVGWKALVYPEDSEKLKSMNKTGEMIYSLFQKYRGGSLKTGLKMYDSTAIGYLLNPKMYETIDTHVAIELKEGMTKGMTLVDLKGYLKKKNNAKVCMDIDPKAFKEWFMKSLENCI